MNKVTVISPANIAFIKYWGKKNPGLNIPFNDSISMNLSNCFTKMSAVFNPRLPTDRVIINREEVSGDKKQRVVDILNIIRSKAKIKTRAEIISENNFPTASGIASSASAFSALALAGSNAAGLNLSKKELSILARLGSGSACRSIVDGFAYWKKGDKSANSYAIQLASTDFWDIRDIVVIVSSSGKKISSTEGHASALSSPYFKTRIKNIDNKVREMKRAILNKDFSKFGLLLEAEAVDLHMMAMTSDPPIFYWNTGTLEVMNNLREWRNEGLSAYFTMDAGANVHVICRAKDVNKLNSKLKKLLQVQSTIINSPALGTHLSP